MVRAKLARLIGCTAMLSNCWKHLHLRHQIDTTFLQSPELNRLNTKTVIYLITAIYDLYLGNFLHLAHRLHL
jgi:hypothetical protein